MDALTMADSFGGVRAPRRSSHVVKKVIEAEEAGGDPLPHGFRPRRGQHDRRAAAGASVAQITITGLGERAGNVPIEDIVLSLL